MATYSEWLISTRALYTTAMTNAYTNRSNPDTENTFYKAWQSMNATSDIASILAPATAFYGSSPDGDEADVVLFQNWLQQNPVVAGWLDLEPTLTFRADQRSSLGTAGNVGDQKRRWKGQPVYTFANGVLIGKDDQIVAAIGTEGGENLDGFGTDTIAYFDGVPFATGTGVPGSVVFRGDTVISGSIKGTGGVVIIEDVIQLERDVENPAGIGVDKDGKIRLRHRGEGFVDLVEEINTVQANVDSAADTAANIAKLWQGVQNTSSARWGTSLIPNSNFSLKTVDPSDSYADRLVGVISVGTTSNIVSIPETGVCNFTGSSVGICLQAVPIESERYAIRIRYRGSLAETLDSDGTSEGLFIAFHETTSNPQLMVNASDEAITHVYDNATPGLGYEGEDVWTTNVSVVYPTGTTSVDAGLATDGISIQTIYQVKSFVYEPSPNATAASLVVWTKNYGGTISLDYIVMTESPLSTTEIDGLIDVAVGEINIEVDDPDISVITDPQMKDSTLWAGYNGATLANSTDGLSTGGDAAITVSVPNGGGGIVSSAVACESDRYLVGAKVRVLSSVGNVVPNVSMFAIENPSQVFSSVGNTSTPPLSYPSGNNRINNIQIVEVDSSGTPDIGGVGAAIAIPIAELDGSEPLYTTFVGTYEATVVYVGTDGTEYSSFDTSIQTTPQLPSLFSLVVYADTECELSVDYVYGRLQGASVNIAQALADTAYTDAHGFVTDMNEQLIKESGSIITNASMAILDSNNKPAGWRTDIASGTLALDTTGDNSIKITQESGQTGTRRLITPPFAIGTADKFSIGISVRGISGAINVTTSVAVCTDSFLPSPYVTIAQTSGSNPDVRALNTTETTIDTDYAIAAFGASEYENILVTWNRASSTLGGLGSIIIEADGDFEVDFVLVKEQTVSFDLADAQAIQRKGEAIAQAAGFVADIGDSLAQEVGSLISNADFTSWYTEDDGTGVLKQRPQKWMCTRDAGFPYRVLETHEIVDTTGTMSGDELQAIQLKETVLRYTIGLNGSAVRFNPGTNGGILSAKWQLPLADSTAVAAGTATTGVYTVSVRVKVSVLQTVGVRIYAHEYDSYPSGGETHVFCADGTYGSKIVENDDRESNPLDKLILFSEGSAGRVIPIPVINVSNPADTTPGYDPNYTNDGDDTNDYQDAGDDQFVEYIPIETGFDGTPADATGNQNLWYDIAGTYRPSGTARFVSFEILIDGNPDTSLAIPDVYVDYVSFIVQPFDSDFAETLADARIASLTGIGSQDWITQNTTLAALLLSHNSRIYDVEVALAAEDPTTTLIPNSFFTTDTGGVPDSWMPTRNTDGTIVLETNAANQATAGSYGSYITLGGTDSSRGILSEAIPILGETGLVPGGLLTNPNFDLAIRYKCSTLSQSINFQMIAHEYYDVNGTFNSAIPQFVYANGVSYTHPSSFQNVVRFNTGTQGAVTAIQGLLNDGVDTTPQTFEITSTDDWNMLVGLYKPFDYDNLPRYVSFEFLIDHDQDGDGTVPEVYIDGIFLQASSETPLLTAVKQTAKTARDKSDANEGIIEGHTTSIANIELAQDEAVIVSTGLASEQGSLIFNAGFAQPWTTTNQAMPLGFWPFADTRGIVRIQNEFPSNTPFDTTQGTQSYLSNEYNSSDTLYLDVGQSGTAAAILCDTTLTPMYSSGFYTRAMALPVTSNISYTDGTGSSQTASDRGVYSIGLKIKPSGSAVSVRIIAHEYNVNMAPYSEGNYVSIARSSSMKAYGSKIGSPVTASYSQQVTLAQLSSGDTTATGWEVIPAGSWTTLAGTYTPSSDAQCVSFSVFLSYDADDETLEFRADQPPDGVEFWHANTRAMAYIDYLLVTPATFSINLAQDIAAGEAYAVQQTLEANLLTLENNLGAESDSLMPNGNFAQKFTDSSVDYVKNWLPTGSGSANKLQLYAADSASKSIGTYVKFNKSAAGGSAPYGSNKSGIISKAIMNPVEMVRDIDGNINAFNIGMRIRGTTDEIASSITGPTSSTNTTTGIVYGSNVAYNADVDVAAQFNNDGLDYSFTSLGDSYALRTTGQSDNSGTEYHRMPNPVADPNSLGYTKQWVLFHVAHTQPDSSWFLYFRPTSSTSKLSSVNATKAYISNDGGITWVPQSISNGEYILANTTTISSNIGTNASLVMVQFENSTPGSLLPINFDYVHVFAWNSGASGYFWIGRESRWFSFKPTTVPDFTVKLIAHETFEAVADPNIIVRGPLVDMVSTTIPTAVGVTVPAAFTSGPPATGVSTAVNLIDLRYSGSSPSTEITIDASAVNDDTGEAITDWRHIVGSYTPNEATTAVSFEVLIDHEPDEVSPVQEVWLDSITMAVSSVGADLASTIADNRVFVEQNFLGGSTPVSPDNVLKNADFSQSRLVNSSYSQGASDDLKRPVNWYYMSDDASWDWSSTDFIFSPESTATNRAIRFTSYSGQSNGIVSSPFRITSDKYKIRLTLKGSVNGMEGSLHAFCSQQTLSNADTIYPSGDAADGDYCWPNDGAQVAANGSYFKRQEFVIDGVSFGRTIVTREFEWRPKISSTTERPAFSSLPQFASLVFQDGGGQVDTTITVYEFSAVPIGKPYGSFDQFYGGTAIYGSQFDNERDLLPDAPRDIVQTSAQVNSIDIEVTDSTSASSAKNKLLLATPRKWYDLNNGTTAQGTSYLYPGVSDLEYREDPGDGDGYRTFSFPSTTTNRIYNVEQIRLTNKDDPKLRWDLVVVERTENTNTPSLSLDLQPTLLANHPTYGNTASTTSSILGRSGGFMRYRFGMFSQNVREPRSSNPDFSEEGIIDTRDLGFQLYGYNIKTAYNSWNSANTQKLNWFVDCHWSLSIDAYTDTADNTYTSLHFSWDIKPTTDQVDPSGASATADLGSQSNEVGYIQSNSDPANLDFTGQHRSVPEGEEITREHVGLIVVASGKYQNLQVGITSRDISRKTEEQLLKPSINESLPTIKLATKRNQKSVFGVVSNCEDPNVPIRTYEVGCWVSTFIKEEGDDRVYVNSLGEGAVWICNINGNLENGDYITTCEIPGYGMRQDDDLLHNYTVAKITQDCTFELDNPYYDCVEFEFEGQTYRKAFVGCTYHCG